MADAVFPGRHQVKNPQSDASVPERGLTRHEAAARLAASGRNELPAQGRRTLLRITLGVFREPMFLMIVAAGMLYLVLGDTGEALLLLAFVCIVLGITIVEERKTERVLEALRDLSSPRVRVLRDGEPQVIPGGDVVVGDVMLLDEGDRVAADAVLLAAHDLSVDESLLTGESAPVGKRALAASPTLRSRRCVRAATACRACTPARWSCRAAERRACWRPGPHRRSGRSVMRSRRWTNPRARSSGRRRRWCAGSRWSAVVLSLAAAGSTRSRAGIWLEAVLAGLTLAMSIVPEEFPVVLTVFMAAGAWRISRRNVLTRRMHGHRNARRRDGAVRRQDRHADREPHGGRGCVGDGSGRRG